MTSLDTFLHMHAPHVALDALEPFSAGIKARDTVSLPQLHELLTNAGTQVYAYGVFAACLRAKKPAYHRIDLACTADEELLAQLDAKLDAIMKRGTSIPNVRAYGLEQRHSAPNIEYTFTPTQHQWWALGYKSTPLTLALIPTENNQNL